MTFWHAERYPGAGAGPSKLTGVGTWMLAIAGVLIAVVVALSPFGPYSLLGVVGLLWVASLARRWRQTLLALLIFLPFAAIPIFIFQTPGWPVLLKDVLLVVPAYVGALVAALRGRLRWSVPADLTFGLVAFVLIVIAQSLQVLPLSPLVVVVGLRIWLFYVPLLPLGAALFERLDQVVYWTRLLVGIALVPAVFGIVQAELIAAGQTVPAYALYGNLAYDATQSFTMIGPADDIIFARIPSTFAFVTQYYNYLLIMLPLALAVWSGDPVRRWRWFGAGAALVFFVAGVTSGARGFFVWGPVVVGAYFLLSHRVSKTIVIAGAVVVIGAGVVFASVISRAAEGILPLAWDYLFVTSFDQMDLAVSNGGWLGNGPGLQSGAVRYVLDTLPINVPQIGLEVWYAKALYEIGLFGLLISVALWIVLLLSIWRARAQSIGRFAYALNTAILVIVGSAILNLIKGSSIEIDPLNVYFWFLPGVAVVLPYLSRRLPDAGPGVTVAAEPAG
jgi:hypothetical protein